MAAARQIGVSLCYKAIQATNPNPENSEPGQNALFGAHGFLARREANAFVSFRWHGRHKVLMFERTVNPPSHIGRM